MIKIQRRKGVNLTIDKRLHIELYFENPCYFWNSDCSNIYETWTSLLVASNLIIFLFFLIFFMSK